MFTPFGYNLKKGMVVMMNHRRDLTAAAVITALIGISFGCLLLRISDASLSGLVRTIFVAAGIVVLVLSVPDLVYGISRIGSVSGRLDFASGALGFAAGIVLIVCHYSVVAVFISLFMIVFPLIRVFAAGETERKKKLKKQLPKMILGVMLVVLLPAAAGLADRLFSLFMTVAGWGVIALSVLLPLGLIIYVWFVSPDKNRISRPKKKNGGNSDIYLGDDDFKEKK